MLYNKPTTTKKMKVVFHFRLEQGVTFQSKLKTLAYTPFSKCLDFEGSQLRDIIVPGG